jgi:hypothetical protein
VDGSRIHFIQSLYAAAFIRWVTLIGLAAGLTRP